VLTPNSSSTTGRPAKPASSQAKAAPRWTRTLSDSIGYTWGPTKSTSCAVARIEKPLSTPLSSMPQAPSPSDTGWVPPPARTACTSSSAQAVTAACGAGPP
jgi:hypothetical protein